MKLLALVAVTGLLLADRRAEACSCAPPPPPCEAYWNVAAVFSGTVTKIATGPHHNTEATFTIENKYKGPILAKTVTVMGGGMCGATFEAGKKYFVYARQDSGVWYAGLCGRTRQLSTAAEDIAYASNLPNRKHGELFGTVLLEDERGTRTPRAGAVVKARNTTYATKTDAAGDYKLTVPPGTYTLDVADAGTHVKWERLPHVEIKHVAGCAREDITVRYNGRIRGTLVDHTGKAAAGIPLSAEGTGTNGALRGVTNAAGEYEIAGVQAGSYKVVVNHTNEGGPSPDAPIPTTFYPGVQDETRAKPVVVVRSGVVAKIDFKLPPPVAVFTVTGTLMSKGQPMPGVHVNFRTELGPQYGRSTGAKTDATGRFTFKDIAGAKVALEVCRPDAGPNNYQTACRVAKHTLVKDWTVDLEYPAP
jgi:hypothetical protein